MKLYVITKGMENEKKKKTTLTPKTAVVLNG